MPWPILHDVIAHDSCLGVDPCRATILDEIPLDDAVHLKIAAAVLHIAGNSSPDGCLSALDQKVAAYGSTHRENPGQLSGITRESSTEYRLSALHDQVTRAGAIEHKLAALDYGDISNTRSIHRLVTINDHAASNYASVHVSHPVDSCFNTFNSGVLQERVRDLGCGLPATPE
jgi:hypothetical protein